MQNHFWIFNRNGSIHSICDFLCGYYELQLIDFVHLMWLIKWLITFDSI